MLIGALRRRSSITTGGCPAHAANPLGLSRVAFLLAAAATLVAGAAVLLLGAQLTTAGPARAASAYPPSTPCALSWQADGRSARGSAATDLIGSGLGAGQAVLLVLHPQIRSLGSFVANHDGAFEAHVAVPTSGPGVRTWLTATSRSASCSTPAPNGSVSSGATSGSGTDTGANGGVDAGANGGSDADPGPSAGPTTGSGAGPTTGSGAGPTTGSSAGAGTSSGGVTPSSTEPTSGGPSSRPAIGDPVTGSRVGLPLSWIIAIALLLVLSGGFAVLFLTRRAG